jgi:cation-transporting ATPase G
MADECCDPGPAADADSSGEHRDAPQRLRDVPALRAAVLSGAFLAAGWILGRTVSEAIGTMSMVAALLVGGATFVPESVRGLLRRRIGVGTLMTIAAVGAVLLGELGEAASLAFLFSISEGLEGYSLARTRRGLRSLLQLAPTQATVLRDGGEVEVDPANLAVADRLVVKPGERMATDGVVTTGRSAVDTAAITGESVPVEVGPGDDVYAGTINGGGVLEVQVTATTEDNSLARIVHIVEEAQDRKGAAQRLADRFARPLVPGVMVLAATIAAAGSLLGDPRVWIERALVVLVAAAPCALAISVPVSVVAAIGAASRFGVLVKGGAALETLGAVRTVALDKTGTLTRNEPVVIEVVTADDVPPDDVLSVAAALEARSEHPLARAVLAAVPGPVPAATDVQAVAGSGLTGRIDGRSARVGRPGYLQPGRLQADVARMQQVGATTVLVEIDGRVLGAIGVRDEPRREAAAAVAALRSAKIDVVMLTGDNPRTAAALAAQAGIEHVHADLRPEDKARFVGQISVGRLVAMVGDGINDAPALATADVGIAMGAMGTDVAIETADVALMGEDLRHLPQALDHARRARRVMLQNLVLSAGILLTLVPLAATGVLGLATVVLTHELAEVLVIANGVRAGRRHTPFPAETNGAAGPLPDRSTSRMDAVSIGFVIAHDIGGDRLRGAATRPLSQPCGDACFLAARPPRRHP